jgi:hypothetical protein
MTRTHTRKAVIVGTMLTLSLAFLAAAPTASAHTADCTGANPTEEGTCLIICDATHLVTAGPHDCTCSTCAPPTEIIRELLEGGGDN